MIFVSRSSVRISFCGGGTDISPYPEEHSGCVISTTINKYVTSTFEPLPGKTNIINCREGERKLISAVLRRMGRTGKVTINSDIAPQSGLGNSAAATVSLLGLFVADKPKNEIAELAYKIEKVDLKNKGGKQDQYASVFGGLNFIEFNGGTNVKVTPLKIKNKKQLERNLLLVNVGKRTNSGDIIKTYNHTVEFLDKTKEITIEMKKQLLRGNLNSFGKLLGEAWEYKKLFTPQMTNNYIESIYETALKNGAFGKVQGAGGGGHMLFYCNDKQKVKRALQKYNVNFVDFNFEKSGLQVKKL
ncbi:MAG: GHMP kinase [Nanoarchaeota archaeon]